MVNAELVSILEKFAASGWDLIDEPSKTWLAESKTNVADGATTSALIKAIEQADVECGSCGCDFDPLYKRALELLKAV